MQDTSNGRDAQASKLTSKVATNVKLGHIGIQVTTSKIPSGATATVPPRRASQTRVVTSIQPDDIWNASPEAQATKVFAQMRKKCEVVKVSFKALGVLVSPVEGGLGMKGVLTPAKAQRLVDVLTQDSADIVQHITALNLYSGSLGDEGAKCLASILPRMKGVESLVVKANKIGAAGGLALAAAIKSLPKLRFLGMASNALGSDACAAVGDALRDLQKLQLLDLSNTQLDDAAAVALSRTLGSCAELAVLDLSVNRIGNAGIAALCGALSRLVNLESLDVSENQCAEEGMGALAHATQHMHKLRKLSIQGNSLDDATALLFAANLPHIEQFNFDDSRLADSNVAILKAPSLKPALSS